MSPDKLMRLALVVALRAMAMAMLFAGLGALGAAAIVPSSMSDPAFAWLDSIRATVWWVALTFLPGAGGALLLMPPRAAILRRAAPSEHPTLPWTLRLLLVGLAVVAAVQWLPIADWWSENLATLRRVIGPGPDRMRLSAVPAVVLLSIPSTATAAAAAFALASALALLVRVHLAHRVLWSCAALQAGLALGGAVALHRLLALASAAATRLAADPELAEASSALAHGIARQQALGGAATRGLLWTLGGYVAAAAAATWLAAPRGTPRTAVPARQPHGLPGIQTAASGIESPAEPTRAPSEASKTFDRSTFVVQPRVTFASFLSRRHAEYDIWAYGDSRGGRIAFSFSWATGVIRQEPAGPPVVALRARSAGWLSKAYDVIDLSTETLLATLRPDKPDWDVLDSRGLPIAQVQEDTRAGRHRYVARAAEFEICRYSWYLGSRGALNPELEIEFAPDADGRIDRAVAIALGPILEHQARLANQPR